MDIKLGDVQVTALIPVAIKANETLRKKPRVRDEVAVEIIKTLGIDTKPLDKFMSHEGVIARTIMLDRSVREFLEKNPECVIVNLASGFDNRFSRVDNGKIAWFDVDLPDSIELRKKVFPVRERVAMISGSVLESDWCAGILTEIEKRSSSKTNPVPVLFLAEGLFMYFTLEEIGKLLSILKMNFKSGTWSGQEIAELCDGIKFVEEHSFNEEMKKYSFGGWLFAKLLPKMNDRWATFKW